MWTALSIGGCGILTQAMIGHDEKHRIGRSLALDFAQRVVRTVGLAVSQQEKPTQQILVETAATVIHETATVIDQAKCAELECTTWQCLPEEIEICSAGSKFSPFG